MRWLGVIAAILFLVLLPALAERTGMTSFVGLASMAMIYAIAGASLNLILGYGGLVSFGHAAFFGVGNCVVGILYVHHAEGTLLLGLIPGSDQFMVTLPAAILVAAIFAAAIGALALRTQGAQFIMITLAFAQMVFFFFVSLKVYGGEDGMIIRRANSLLELRLRDKETMYYVIAGTTFLYFAFMWRVINSSFGNVLAGIRQNEKRMTAMGIDVYGHKLAGFVLAGAGAGMAGALLAVYLRFASPDTMHWTKSGELLVIVILGGVGTFLGPIWGAAAFVLLHTYLPGWTENWQLVLGVILLAVVLWTKGGIQGLLDTLALLIRRGRTGASP